MKQPSRQFLCLFILTLLNFMMYSCTDVEEEVIPAIEKGVIPLDISKAATSKEINAVEKQFYSKHNISLFNEKINDSIEIVWQAKWDKSYQKINGASEAFVYIPLSANPTIGPMGGGIKPITITKKRFLLAKREKSNYIFFLANYIPDLKGIKIETFDKEFSFLKFTGTLILEDLQKQSVHVITYEGGVAQEPTNTSPIGGNDISTQGWDCRMYVECTWVIECRDGWEVRHTAGYDHCDEPEQPYYCWEGTWQLSSTRRTEECTWIEDPDLPDDGDGGSGGGGGDSSPQNPCDHADVLETNSAFKTKMAQLLTNTGLTYETAFTYSGNTYGDQQNGAPGDLEMFVNINGQIDGWLHSHPAGVGSLPSFSGTDLQAIYFMAQGGYIRNVDTFTAGVVTVSGTTYILKIDDIASFNAYGAEHLASETDRGLVDIEYFYLQGMYRSQTSSIIESHEAALLQILEGSGLKLFRGRTSDFSEWTPIEKTASNTVVVDDCN